MKKSNILRSYWYSLSPKQRYILRKLYYLPIDTFDKFSGRRNKYVPPRGYIYTGSPASSDDYLKQGNHQVELLKKYMNLKSEDFVLDIGSGIGRTAIALTNYLSKKGIYEGFDVVESGVDWCNKKIKSDYSNFNFKYLPVFNDLYNSGGENASTLSFPYEDNSFTKVFSFSVFTHMQINEISNYLKETYRVTKPSSLCLSTFFLYDNKNEEFISNKENFAFKVKKDGYRLMSDTTKSGNIAIHKDKLKEMMQVNNFEIVTIIDGFWKSEKRESQNIEYQDIVVFKKVK